MTLGYIAIAQACILAAILAFISVLVIKDFSWELYQSKGKVFKVVSFIVFIIKFPLLKIPFLFILNNLWSFSDNDGILKYVSIAATIVSASIIALFSYFGAHLLNLTIPNDGLLPWADVSHQPQLLLTL